MRICSLDDCTRVHYGRGYCNLHYSRWRTHGDPHTVATGHRYTTLDVSERLHKHSESEGACRVYTRGNPSRSGHRLISINGRDIGVHRAAWEAANGPIPAGLCVCHKCDNPSCINVQHLFLGTVADNNADRDRKGRQVAPVGSKHPRAKVAEWQVLEIRKLYAAGGMSQRSLAAQYGVSQRAIWNILSGNGWKHVPDIPAGIEAAS